MPVSKPGSILEDWRRAYGDPLFQGTIRQTFRDFEVTEELGFTVSGDGEHDYLWIEKTDANTAWVADRLSQHAGVPGRDVGYAGMKDRRAVTRQWFSVRRKTGAGTDWAGLEAPGVRILEQSRNERKLKRGAHTGNRFRIAVRAPNIPVSDVAERLGRIRASGVPNYFGEQRFGKDGANIELAESLFAGRRLSRQKRSIALSAARSALFNHILQQRVIDGTWDRLLPGDAVCLDGSNSIFPVVTVNDELVHRCERLDIHAGGALWGRGDMSSSGEVRMLEQRMAGRFHALASGLEQHVDRSRRALRLAVGDLDWHPFDGGILLEFRLAKGGYATGVLRELLQYG